MHRTKLILSTLLSIMLITAFAGSGFCGSKDGFKIYDRKGKPTIVFSLVPRIKGENLSPQECESLIRNLNKSLQQEFNEAGFETHRDRMITGFLLDSCKRSYATQQQTVTEDEIISIARDNAVDYVVIGMSEVDIEYDEDYEQYTALVDINGDFLGVEFDPPSSYALNLTGEYMHPQKDRLIKLAMIDISRKIARLRTIDTVLKHWERNNKKK
ncbi:hypothetical protein [Maridesulfovibrio hydrothermalis]|uniref:Lipoprotein n=1 Tax=Maridesulfovibrio hydrothermalis AM13 = DSM 14728 TaxID=1121451 RepID=L0RG47_9BACT|nr:hypothetical protein [Maridesulfovibrio hydrothermalis]CCO25185.1 conserved exported protein of unknown function [Maridesulfovibrio hydrothermalis AM13 = DSM 14728]